MENSHFGVTNCVCRAPGLLSRTARSTPATCAPLALGELAAGLAHEIRNRRAGIAGVVDITGKELPAYSPSRAVIGDVQREVLHVRAILTDLLAYSRPRPLDFIPRI